MPGWQEFLDTATKDPGVKSAGIFGQDGVSWAATDGLAPSPAEVQELVAGVHDNGRLLANGAVLAGAKYMFLAPLSNLGPGLSGVVARKGSTTLEVILAGKAVVLATTEGLAELTGNVFAARQMVDHGF